MTRERSIDQNKDRNQVLNMYEQQVLSSEDIQPPMKPLVSCIEAKRTPGLRRVLLGGAMSGGSRFPFDVGKNFGKYAGNRGDRRERNVLKSIPVYPLIPPTFRFESNRAYQQNETAAELFLRPFRFVQTSIRLCHQSLKSRHSPSSANSTTAIPSSARRGNGSPSLRASMLVPVDAAHILNMSSDVT